MPTTKPMAKTKPEKPAELDSYDQLKASFCTLLDLDFSKDDTKEGDLEELMGLIVEIAKKEVMEEITEALQKLSE